MMATEIALRKLPIRVNSIAPGVYSSEMTGDKIVATRGDTDAIGKPLVPIPAERSGRLEFFAIRRPMDELMLSK
jgi:hypothetical protein